MKKLLLILLIILSVNSLSGQVVFSVENPAALQGSYEVTYATPDGGWGTPDMIDSDNAIIGSLVQAKDASAADSLACGTVQNTADFVSGKVETFDMYNAGSGYITGNSNVTGGSGTGLTFDIEASAIVGVDSLDSASLNAGQGYVTDINVVTTTDGAGTGLTVDIEAKPLGAIDSLDLTTLVGGSGYTDATAVATTSSGGGTGLTVDIFTVAGAVDSVAINTKGTGYEVGEVITISAGGSDATVNVGAVTNGEITSVTINNVGDNSYQSGDVITISGGDETASIEVLTVQGGDITSIQLSDIGTGYVEGDTVIISGGDMNAMVHITDATLGKIAILYRGDCQFGTKALNAQNAGAIACVIINNAPGGPVGMGPGTDGVNVTIPVFMISLEDGQNLIETLNSETVDVFIGNKTGFYANDIGLRNGGVLKAKSLATPSVLAQSGTDFNFDVGAWIYNFGFNDQKNIILRATVTLDGEEVYSEEIADPVSDLSSRDSVFLSLPNFSLPTYNTGEYVLNYEIVSDSTDDYGFDNTLDANFNINDDYMFTYANVSDTSGLPTSSGTGYRSTLQSCIVFKDENASKLIPTGVTFSAFKGPEAQVESFEGEPMIIEVLEWNDEFTDISDATYDLLSPKAFTEYNYPEDLGGVPVTAKIEPFALEDDQRYLFCVYSFNENIFVMYDGRIDYTENVNNYLEPFTSVKDDEGVYFPAGFGTDATPSIGISMVDAEFLDLKDEETSLDMRIYPSPASSSVTVDFNGNDVSNVQVLNLAGQSVISKDVKNGQMNLNLDVNGLENGLYIFRVSLSDGMVTTMNFVVNH